MSALSHQPASRARPLRDLHLYADGASLGLRHNQVMVVFDVLNRRVVQPGPRQDTQGQGGREEVELAISEATVAAIVS